MTPMKIPSKSSHWSTTAHSNGYEKTVFAFCFLVPGATHQLLFCRKCLRNLATRQKQQLRQTLPAIRHHRRLVHATQALRPHAPLQRQYCKWKQKCSSAMPSCGVNRVSHTSPTTSPAPSSKSKHPAIEWNLLTIETLHGPLLEHRALLSLLHSRPEWKSYRVEIHYRKRQSSRSFYEIACIDTVDCAKKWRAFYLDNHDIHPPGTLLIQSTGEHSHDGTRGSRRLFTPEQLQVAQHSVDSGDCNTVASLKLALSAAKFPADTLPSQQQLSDWLKNHKRSKRTTLRKDSNVVELVRVDLASIPRALPPETCRLFLCAEPMLNDQEVCVLFTCRGMLRQLERYAGEAVCVTVDAKAYCERRLAQDYIGEVLCPKSPTRLLATHNVRLVPTPAARCRLFRASSTVRLKQTTAVSFVVLMRCGAPADTLHDHRSPHCRCKCIRITTLQSKPPAQRHCRIRGLVTTSFIGSKSSTLLWQRSVTNLFTRVESGSRPIKAGLWRRFNFYVCFLPFLFCQKFGMACCAVLSTKRNQTLFDGSARMSARFQPTFAASLQTRTLRQPISVSGLDFEAASPELVVGVNRPPAEAQHAPWQRQLAALGGKGDVTHILAVLQKLYEEYWQHWYDWASDAPLRLHVEDIPMYITRHELCTYIIYINESYNSCSTMYNHMVYYLHLASHINNVYMYNNCFTTMYNHSLVAKTHNAHTNFMLRA